MRKMMLAVVLVCICFSADAAGVPALRGRVNDSAGMLGPYDREKLESSLEEMEAECAIQAAILTVESLEGEAIETYANRVANAWGLGEKGKNNGLLIVVSREERKVRIEVGLGLEALLTNRRCEKIIRNDILPAFREGRYADGLRGSIRGIKGAASGTALTENSERGKWFSSFVHWKYRNICLIIFGIAILFAVTATFNLHTAFSGLLGTGAAETLYFYLASRTKTADAVSLGLIGYFLGWVIRYYIDNGPIAEDWRSDHSSWDSDAFHFGGGGGFSGGGGSFGGGGASGSW